VAGFAAAGANLLECGIDFAGDPLLRVELEAKEPTRRDRDRGDQPDQNFFSFGGLRLPIVQGANCHIVGQGDGVGRRYGTGSIDFRR
jgi:hypothetical protein